MKKKLLLVGLLALTGLTLSSCLDQKTETKKTEWVLTYAENQSEKYPTTLGAERFAKLVEEKTEGRIKILIQAEGKLGNEKKVVEQLRFGGVDFARISLAELAEPDDSVNVLMLPFLYENADHMWRVLDGEIGQSFLDQMKEKDLIGLSWYDAGARNFYNRVRPIQRLEDMEGLKFRVQESKLMEEMVEALGASAVQMAYDEVYAGLERQVIDGAENNWPSYQFMAHYEIAPYYTIDEHTRIPEMQLCSGVTWNKLTPEDQKLILECAKESAQYERQLWKEEESRCEEAAEEKGVKVNILSQEERKRFQEAMMPIYEKYGKDEQALIQQIKALGQE